MYIKKNTNQNKNSKFLVPGEGAENVEQYGLKYILFYSVVSS